MTMAGSGSEPWYSKEERGKDRTTIRRDYYHKKKKTGQGSNWPDVGLGTNRVTNSKGKNGVRAKKPCDKCPVEGIKHSKPKAQEGLTEKESGVSVGRFFGQVDEFAKVI